MSCTSPKTILKTTLLTLTFLLSCTFIASVVWLLKTKAASSYENYYLSRINISVSRNEVNIVNESEVNNYKELIKIEIAMRRVDENSRRLKEYTKSLLWNNKDRSLWCVLFKDGEKRETYVDKEEKRGLSEDHIRTLRDQKMREAVIHLRHHGMHHRRKTDVLANFIT